jgi:GAF domain-containing protein
MTDELAMMQVLYRIAHAVGGSLRLDETLQAVLHALQEALGARGVVIRLLNPAANAFDVAASVGLSQAFLDRIDSRVAPGNIHARMLAQETVSAPDLRAIQGEAIPLAHRMDSALLAREQVTGLVALPLQVRGRVFGSLTLYCAEGCGFDEAAMTVISAASDLAAVAIENARLHSALFRIAEALTSSLELGPLLDQVLNATVMEMGLNAASVRLLDRSGKKLDLVASHGLSERYLQKGTVTVAGSPIDQRVLKGEPVVIYDVAGEEGFQYPEQAAAEGIRSVLAVPLRVKDTVVGVMRVYSAQPRHFTQVGIDFLQSVAGLVGVAIENARLYGALRARYEDLKLDVSEWYRFLSLG